MFRKHPMVYTIISVIIVLAAVFVIYTNLPKFGRSPKGERLERIRQSPNFSDGKFHNRHVTPQLTSDKNMFAVMLGFLFGKNKDLRPDKPVPAVKTDLKSLSPGDNYFIWFGHSSTLIQIDGKRILTDPVFETASPVSFFNKPFKGTDIYKPHDMPDIDYLIITHDHWDHLDYETVIKLKDRVGKVICPLGVGEHFEYWGFAKDDIIELDWDQKTSPGDGFTIYCLPARHFSGRSFSPNNTLWASFMVQTPSMKIYIGGDGGYDTHFAEIGKRFPGIDVAIMENGQYNDDWRYIHLMPKYLVKAIKDLNPRKVFTVHNSKYALARHPWTEPLDNIASAAEKDSINLFMPVIGEVVELDSAKKEINRWWKE